MNRETAILAIRCRQIMHSLNRAMASLCEAMMYANGMVEGEGRDDGKGAMKHTQQAINAAVDALADLNDINDEYEKNYMELYESLRPWSRPRSDA